MSIYQHFTAKTVFLFFLFLILGLTPVQAGVNPLSPLDSTYKSPAKAVQLSLFSTLVPLAVGGLMFRAGQRSLGNSRILTSVGAVTGFLGVAFGPSVGHSYAENSGRGAVGIGIRLATSFTGGLLIAYSGANIQQFSRGRSRDTSDDATAIVAILFSVTAVSAVYDIITSGKSAEQYNRKRSIATVQFTPTYFTHSSAPGLALQIGF